MADNYVESSTFADSYVQQPAPSPHQVFDVDQKPQQGQQYPPDQQSYPEQYPPDQQSYPEQYPPDQQSYPEQYPPNEQPYPQQYTPNQQPYPQHYQDQAHIERLAVGIIIMVCCFPFSLCCIPCLFPKACC